MPIDWPNFVLQRRINQPLSDVRQALCDPASVAAGTELALGAEAFLVVDEPFQRAPFPFERSLRAPGTLHTKRGKPAERVEVEVGPWADDATAQPPATQLSLRPLARHPERWGGRRLRRYFELAHGGADAVARLAEAS